VRSTTRFCIVISSALSLATAIVYATCGLAYGPTGGNCVLTADKKSCYQQPWTNGGCQGTGKGNCTSKPVPEPLLSCKYIPSSPSPQCTPSAKISSQNVLCGSDLSGLCGA